MDGAAVDMSVAVDLSLAADAAAQDAGQPAVPPSTGLDVSGAVPRFASEDAETLNLASCFDGIDNRGSLEGLIDCADPACAALPSCCVGDGSCCAPAEAPRTLSFRCDGSDALRCALDAGFEARSFGLPGPFLDRGAFAPGGDGRFDSGLVLTGDLDVRGESLGLTFTFGAAEACASDCRETVAAGLVAAPFAGGDETHVEPLAALQHTSARGEVAFLVAGARVGTLPLEAGAYTLALNPTGDVEAQAPGGSTLRATIAPPANVALAVWGHSRNPSAGRNAGDRLLALSFERSLCDVPGTWRGRAPRDELSPSALEAVSVDLDGRGSLVAALADERGLRAFEEQPDGRLRTLASPVETGLVALAPGERLGAGVAAVAGAEGLGALWVALGDGTGAARIVRAERVREGDANEAPFAVRPDAPRFEGALHGVSAVRAFDVVELPEATVLVVETRDLRGGLGLFARGDAVGAGAGDGWLALHEGLAEAVARLDLGPLGHPSLVAHGGSWRLHLEARRSARRGVVLLASDTLVAWRLVAGQTLGPSGAGFDRFGAGLPSAVGRGDVLLLCYAGDDGIQQRLGCTARTASESAALLRRGS